MARVAVIGAGIMGLAAAHRARQLGHEVDLYEAAPEAGGMAAHFMLGDVSIERFYHFVCKTDVPTFEMLAELGLSDRLHWVRTSMGQFVHGKLYRWGDPIALLRFPHLSLIEKFRYGLLMGVAVNRARWDGLEHENARDWIIRWCGRRAYTLLWQKLFDYKFYELAGNVSAAWIWTRIRRIGRSRSSIMREQMGYIEGGSETLVQALAAEITRLGGRVHLATPVSRVLTEHGAVRGLRLANHRDVAADAVIATVPTPLIERLCPDLPDAARTRYRAIVNIGVVCVVLRLTRSVTPHFWVNVNDDDFEIPGIIEFSQLRPTGETVVYVPYYMPVTHPRWAWTDAQFLADALACLHRINPAITEATVRASHVGRLRHAQPVCTPGFAAMLPPIQTEIAGLQIADTCFYYPEDRGLAESLRLGRRMAEGVAAVKDARPGALPLDPAGA
jgi:protoporphyrinogen oxidase